jgi:hypothetical protein
MTEVRTGKFSAQDIVGALAGFRCSGCGKLLRQDMSCGACHRGYCPVCGRMAVSWAACLENCGHRVGYWSIRFRTQSRSVTGGLPRQVLLPEWTSAIEIPDPPVLVNSRAFRSARGHRGLRSHFGKLARLLDALAVDPGVDPLDFEAGQPASGTGVSRPRPTRRTYAESLLMNCGVPVQRRVFRSLEIGVLQVHYFAQQPSDVERAVGALAERFEGALEAWIRDHARSRVPYLLAGRRKLESENVA